MSEHVSDLDIARFRAGTLDRERVKDIGAHVRGCAECAAHVWSSREMRNATAEVTRNATATRSSRMRWAAAAAVLVIVAALAAWMLLRSTQRSAPPPRPVIVEHPAPKHPWDALVADALRSGEIKRPVWFRHENVEVVRGPEDHVELRLLAPIGIAVESQTPRFRWTPAASCEVTIAREGNTLAKSGRITGTSWTPATPLARGESYDWQVTIGRRHRITSRFRVLGDDEARLLASVRATRNPTALGIVAAHLGVVDEALAQLAASPNPRARALAEKIRRW